jgi:hypothetical protein
MPAARVREPRAQTGTAHKTNKEPSGKSPVWEGLRQGYLNAARSQRSTEPHSRVRSRSFCLMQLAVILRQVDGVLTCRRQDRRK